MMNKFRNVHFSQLIWNIYASLQNMHLKFFIIYCNTHLFSGNSILVTSAQRKSMFEYWEFNALFFEMNFSIKSTAVKCLAHFASCPVNRLQHPSKSTNHDHTLRWSKHKKSKKFQF